MIRIRRATAMTLNQLNSMGLEALSARMLKEEEITYTVEHGIRYLKPYWSIYSCHTKERWFGRKLVEIFTTEFPANNKYYAAAAVRCGRIFVNNEKLFDLDYVLKGNDSIVHVAHRHESPIPDREIKIIENSQDFFVIDKPAGIPVHPCGPYSIHSITHQLRNFFGIEGLRPGHRLDRTTSGVLIFTRNHKTDRKFKKDVISGKILKEYVAKVEGIFPKEEIVCDAPIFQLTAKLGIRMAKVGGQKCLSKFRRLYTDEDENTSIVSCSIETGRTHQIRVHLQFLGYPIVDDNLYNDEVWGPNKGKSSEYGKSESELVDDIYAKHTNTAWHESTDPNYEERLRRIGACENTEKVPALEDMGEYDPICLNCNVVKKKAKLKDYGICLHCWRYKGDWFEFEAPLPEWAEPIKAKFSDKSVKDHPQPPNIDVLATTAAV